jgi:hypothetical protein
VSGCDGGNGGGGGGGGVVVVVVVVAAVVPSHAAEMVPMYPQKAQSVDVMQALLLLGSPSEWLSWRSSGV